VLQKRGAVLLLGILALALLAAGCGGGDGDDASAETAITKAEFVKQGNAICQKATEKFSRQAEALLEELGADESPGDRPATDLVSLLETEADEIRALGAPAGDEAEVDAILSGIEQTADSLESGEGSGDGTSAYAQAEKPADAYGLDACPLG
jgi:hypothetical protein